jgi:hypothetical protein
MEIENSKIVYSSLSLKEQLHILKVVFGLEEHSFGVEFTNKFLEPLKNSATDYSVNIPHSGIGGLVDVVVERFILKEIQKLEEKDNKVFEAIEAILELSHETQFKLFVCTKLFNNYYDLERTRYSPEFIQARIEEERINGLTPKEIAQLLKKEKLLVTNIQEYEERVITTDNFGKHTYTATKYRYPDEVVETLLKLEEEIRKNPDEFFSLVAFADSLDIDALNDELSRTERVEESEEEKQKILYLAESLKLHCKYFKNNSISLLKENLNVLKGEIAQLTSVKNSLLSQLDEAFTQIDQAILKKHEAHENMNALTEENNKLKKTNSSLTKENEKLKEKVNTLFIAVVVLCGMLAINWLITPSMKVKETDPTPTTEPSTRAFLF